MLLAGLAMLAAGPAALALKPGRLQPAAPAVELETVLPLAFDGWRVDPRLVQTVALEGRPGDVPARTINRTYTNDRGGSINLTVSYGGADNDALKGRRPEESLVARGFRISEIRRDRVYLDGHSIPVTRMTALRGGRTEPTTYWITVGDRVVRDRGEWISAQLAQGLAGRAVEGLQFRISTVEEDAPRAFAAHDRFIATLLAETPAAGLIRLLGARSS